MSEITEKELKLYKENLEKTAKSDVIKRAVMNNGINEVAEEPSVKANLHPTFSHELKTSKITAQKKSGRCWLFAALNTIRYEMEQDYKIKNFEFSQNYLSFWDRVEKANTFLSLMIETAQTSDDDRRMEALMKNPDEDGGQWANAVALIKKYGLVPKYAMPETKVSNDTDDFSQILSQKLRLDAKKLREAARNCATKEELEEMKNDAMKEVYKMCVYAFGKPVEKFDFEYRDKDDNFHKDYNLTPQEFYLKYTRKDLDDYVVIANAPDRKYETFYRMPDENNILGSNQVEFINVDLETFKDLTLKQLLDGKATWFGCDVLQQMDRKKGLLAHDLYRYDKLFDIDLNFSKADRLKYHEACLAHAMVITGVNLIDDKPTKWKVENSWGDKIGADGYFVMDDKWFDEYVYEVVINKKYLSKELLDVLDTEPVRLELWDSMA